ncbi:uncharacterized protein LOC125836029 [Solanum verrucosum]|uniref:uncharacterized protein LOC125836029 n=1 Tax=Solanum verrucosum TaxID=315347 RepID=UPI0020D1EA46|nr:uncharacterized protein LOC125836029 [Solanum verrucosum]
MRDHVAEFNKILDYRDVLHQTNPGSTCVMKLKDSKSENGMKQFHSFYICFDAMKKGFQQGCRRCIGLDGCFLKGICKGQLLVVVAKDANNQMYPITWAVIGTESKLTWKWFMTILQDDLNLGDGSQPLSLVISKRMCARHILANWSQNFRGIERRKKFLACARSTFEAQFQYNINALSKLGKRIVEALIKYNKEKWCKAFFQTFSKCDSIDNNMAESFNAWILGPRNKTIGTMLEEIKVKVMSRVSKSRAFAETWTDGISPMAMMVFNTNVTRSMQCNIEWNGDDGFEVLKGVYKHTVNLGQQKYSCRSWELKGIPCAHDIAAMNHLNMDASQAISSWYRKETYLKTYSHFIQPVPNIEM